MFTFCFIMGFQIHLPVTMFPADVTSSESQGTNGSNPDNKLVFQKENIERTNAPVVSDKELLIAGDLLSPEQSSEQYNAAGIIGSESVHQNDRNTNANQARPEDLHEQNGGAKLTGLDRDLSTNYFKSAKSVINRLPEDLQTNRLELIQQKLANLSSNLLTRKNILPSNNGRPAVNEREINKDGADKYNNNTVIKSRQSLSTQTSEYWVENDKVQGTYENSELDAISWPSVLVNKCPQGFSKEDHYEWKRKVHTLDIVKIEPGCGSMQNRLVVFNDSSKACIRYRLNTDQVQGEILSYYLGKLLGMQYTATTTLYTMDHSRQWKDIREGIISAKWSEDKAFIVTKWIESLEPVYMPSLMKDMKSKLHRGNYQLYDMALGELCDLMQWSDLIVFDYVSANLDRVVNNMFNLKWNHKMLEKPIHNLERSSRTGQYVFIDNESGLFHGYRLLDTYNSYHEHLLDQVCMFKPATVKIIRELYAQGNSGQLLQELFVLNESLHSYLPRMPLKNMNILQQRIGHVYKHMQLCKYVS